VTRDPAAARGHERPVALTLGAERPDDRDDARNESTTFRRTEQLFSTVERSIPTGDIAGHVSGRHESGDRQSEDVGLVAAHVDDTLHRHMTCRTRRRAHRVSAASRRVR
jgi:hypothetical protein